MRSLWKAITPRRAGLGLFGLGALALVLLADWAAALALRHNGQNSRIAVPLRGNGTPGSPTAAALMFVGLLLAAVTAAMVGTAGTQRRAH